MTAELALRAAAQQQQLRDAKHTENLQLRDAARAQNAAAQGQGVRALNEQGDRPGLLFRARRRCNNTLFI